MPKVPERKNGYTPEGRKKRILLNAFDMNGIGHVSPGQWQNPEDRTTTKNRLGYWIELAKLLERGKFNALFLADNFGTHDIYKGSHEPAIRSATQWPLYDPFVVVPAMAAVTESLAFGITSCTTFEPPFLLAKRFSTLDHITNGRVAWNVVTSWSDTSARALGLESHPEHDTRYAIAEEYLSLTYKLWEGSWADDAVIKDSSISTYADPAKIRKVEHRGKYFRCVSAHQVDPSPQRTPVIFQAGMTGSAFAAKHAECVFLGGRSATFVGEKVRKTRQLAAASGRDPMKIKFFTQFTAVLGETDDEAQEKYNRHRQYALPEGGLALFGSTASVDLSKFPIDEEFPTDPNHPLLKDRTTPQIERLLNKPSGYDSWTPRLLAEYHAVGGSGNVSVGSAKTVADAMENFILESDIDGFNIGHVVVPQAWEDVVKYLIPELENRGWLGENGQQYPVPGGTARENLYGIKGESRLDPSHPGSQYKFNVYPPEPEERVEYIGIR
ncbi:luciferase-like domain-containing protein [Bisporella sp. PMI_857]|nr:luciferase-like domain-containing protein [Bisporella sp. PMI_857]